MTPDRQQQRKGRISQPWCRPVLPLNQLRAEIIAIERTFPELPTSDTPCSQALHQDGDGARAAVRAAGQARNCDLRRVQGACLGRRVRLREEAAVDGGALPDLCSDNLHALAGVLPHDGDRYFVPVPVSANVNVPGAVNVTADALALTDTRVPVVAAG
jgi:hypothetical protein